MATDSNSSSYEQQSWQKDNVDLQNRDYGIPRVKRGANQMVKGNEQEPAGPGKGPYV
jgi:hypothetical protein